MTLKVLDEMFVLQEEIKIKIVSAYLTLGVCLNGCIDNGGVAAEQRITNNKLAFKC